MNGVRAAGETRALVLAPAGRDADVARAILRGAGFETDICRTLHGLTAEFARGAGFAVVAEEAIDNRDFPDLVESLASQPPWSDLPIILLMRRSSGVERVPGAQRLMRLLGNVSFLERPFHATTLVSAARAALRGRLRQYEARSYIDERIAAADKLRKAEESRRLAIEAAQIGTWHYFPATRVLEWDARCRALFGISSNAEISYATFLAGLHPEDRHAADAAVRAALDPAGSGVFVLEYRTVGIEDGIERWIAAAGRTQFEDGVPVRFAGTVRDITQRRRAEQQRHLLLNELNHRVKNTLATIQSIARQTLNGADQSVRRAFEGRLMALSQAHNILTREHWISAQLHELLANTLAPYGTADGTRFHIAGPDVRLSPRATLALALALHEMATNAAKYGALSNSSGCVRIRWSTRDGNGRPRLRMHWLEFRGPSVAAPTRKGFGSKLIERGLAMELDGRVRLDFWEKGLRCRIELPLGQPEDRE